MFEGKKSSPTKHYQYSTPEKRSEGIDRFVKQVTQVQAMKAAYKANLDKPHTLQVGQIVHSSWGYDQTQNDFYKIIELKGKTRVVLQQLQIRKVDGSTGHMSCSVMPVLDENIGEPFTKKANGLNQIKLTSYASASLWDERPKYQSWYA